MPPRIYIVRHGETEWSRAGQHTGRTDVPLTAVGEEQARAVGLRLAAVPMAHVFTSPRLRARRTCELLGWGAAAQVDDDLAEWDYGRFEGKRSAEIRLDVPGWNLFRDGAPEGETPDQVRGRADRVITRLKSLQGNIAVCSHGHFSRVLGARWMALPVEHAKSLLLDTASVSILSFDHGRLDEPAVAMWNWKPDLPL